MAHGRAAVSRVVLRGGVFYYVRRVPKRLALLDSRVIVRISLKTSDHDAAAAAAVVVERALLDLWSALEGQDSPDAWRRYNAALERARLEGFAYVPVADLAQASLPDLLARLESLMGRTADRSAAEALLGGVPVPQLTLNGALARYFEIAVDEVLGKRPDQLRRWQNARRLAVANFIAALGEDRPLASLVREDARTFQTWWLARMRDEGLGRNAVNKQIGHLSRIFRVVSEEARIPYEPIFAGLTLTERKKQRPSFARAFVEGVLLRPGALAGLNAQARGVLLLCMETGMGLEEATSLLPDHIVLADAVPHVRVVSRDEALQKTEYRPRVIPLVGVALLAAQAHSNGFPRYRGKPTVVSNVINKFLRENGLLPTPDHSLYALRHSFQDRLIEADAPDRMQADLMGHKFTRERYGGGYPLTEQAKVLNKMAYAVGEGFGV